jgi:hypothetical protein
MNPDIKGFLNVGRQAITSVPANTVTEVTFSGTAGLRSAVYVAVAAGSAPVYCRIVGNSASAPTFTNVSGWMETVDADSSRIFGWSEKVKLYVYCTSAATVTTTEVGY